jgi:hypothetical protein
MCQRTRLILRGFEGRRLIDRDRPGPVMRTIVRSHAQSARKSNGSLRHSGSGASQFHQVIASLTPFRPAVPGRTETAIRPFAGRASCAYGVPEGFVLRAIAVLYGLDIEQPSG